MTGYGKAETEINDKKITVEVRSLNSKQLDLSVKSPAVYRQAEQEVRNLASRSLNRGKVDIFISLENTAGTDTVNINKAAFKEYLTQINGILSENGFGSGEEIKAALIPVIMRMPEVVKIESEEIPEEETAALVKTAGEALGKLDGFRVQEGAILIADILERVASIEKLKSEVLPFEAVRTETIKNRIRENIASLGTPVDENRLEQEMIYYVEKLDITEEKVRLDNHCKYFREVAASEDNAGRKLGFITQEIGREINTMGSKANNSDIQKIVVRMKDELEKIKEQLLNIL